MNRLALKLRAVADMLEYVLKVRGSVDGAAAEIAEARALLDDPTTDPERFFLLVIHQNVEPEPLREYPDDRARLRAARRNRKLYGDRDGLFRLTTGAGRAGIQVQPFSGGEVRP